MARRAAAGPHIRRIKAHHKRHKKHLYRLLHRVRSHPGCYKPGYRPKRGKVPKSIPRKPAGLNKRGSGLWDNIKAGFSKLFGLAKKHTKGVRAELTKQGKAALGELGKEAKARLSEYGQRAGAAGKEWLKGQAKAVGGRMRNHVEGYITKGDNHLRSLATKIDKGVSKYTGGVGAMPGRTLKKGSGLFGRGGRGRYRPVMAGLRAFAQARRAAGIRRR